ncbi:hypothetical protein DSAG12_02793 [Promethearchaeum syntrophicum]|uniref:Uncharacterized protein n=1 Tax=Promethearchaeum syntrophicum TaxID=2594042 RepID=A0A5B9DCW1_9ARCH|nr:hypothetical protein [Candidatus Prometheoarchaeum syntrophicum]QEE16962.1 hypothetical protein DSAG12_02793 [Candidatus Prometheoarchaeum syntrophicum]
MSSIHDPSQILNNNNFEKNQKNAKEIWDYENFYEFFEFFEKFNFNSILTEKEQINKDIFRVLCTRADPYTSTPIINEKIYVINLDEPIISISQDFLEDILTNLKSRPRLYSIGASSSLSSVIADQFLSISNSSTIIPSQFHQVPKICFISLQKKKILRTSLDFIIYLMLDQETLASNVKKSILNAIKSCKKFQKDNNYELKLNMVLKFAQHHWFQKIFSSQDNLICKFLLEYEIFEYFILDEIIIDKNKNKKIFLWENKFSKKNYPTDHLFEKVKQWKQSNSGNNNIIIPRKNFEIDKILRDVKNIKRRNFNFNAEIDKFHQNITDIQENVKIRRKEIQEMQGNARYRIIDKEKFSFQNFLNQPEFYENHEIINKFIQFQSEIIQNRLSIETISEDIIEFKKIDSKDENKNIIMYIIYNRNRTNFDSGFRLKTIINIFKNYGRDYDLFLYYKESDYIELMHPDVLIENLFEFSPDLAQIGFNNEKFKKYLSLEKNLLLPIQFQFSNVFKKPHEAFNSMYDFNSVFFGYREEKILAIWNYHLESSTFKEISPKDVQFDDYVEFFTYFETTVFSSEIEIIDIFEDDESEDDESEDDESEDDESEDGESEEDESENDESEEDESEEDESEDDESEDVDHPRIYLAKYKRFDQRENLIIEESSYILDLDCPFPINLPIELLVDALNPNNKKLITFISCSRRIIFKTTLGFLIYFISGEKFSPKQKRELKEYLINYSESALAQESSIYLECIPENFLKLFQSDFKNTIPEKMIQKDIYEYWEYGLCLDPLYLNSDYDGINPNIKKSYEYSESTDDSSIFLVFNNLIHSKQKVIHDGALLYQRNSSLSKTKYDEQSIISRIFELKVFEASKVIDPKLHDAILEDKSGLLQKFVYKIVETDDKIDLDYFYKESINIEGISLPEHNKISIYEFYNKDNDLNLILINIKNYEKKWKIDNQSIVFDWETDEKSNESPKFKNRMKNLEELELKEKNKDEENERKLNFKFRTCYNNFPFKLKTLKCLRKDRDDDIKIFFVNEIKENEYKLMQVNDNFIFKFISQMNADIGKGKIKEIENLSEDLNYINKIIRIYFPYIEIIINQFDEYNFTLIDEKKDGIILQNLNGTI